MSHQLLTIRLSRQDATPWGFRLQGGKDFAQPLLIQKVNGGSLSERAGLQVGDALIKVNNLDVYSLKHKEAQDSLVKAGNDFTLTVERGPGATWKPHVQVVGGASPGGISPVTKTSLAHNKPPASPIGQGHNLSPRPFPNSPQGADTVKAIVNKQYNTPVNIYSEESIAETLSAQAEVLAGGVLGVNFKKNERTYDAGRSEVFKMVHEGDKEPREPEPDVSGGNKYYSQMSHALGGQATSPRPLTPLAKKLGQTQEERPQGNVKPSEIHKQEIQKQEIQKQEIHKQEIHKQEIHKQEMHKQEIHKQEMHKQEMHKQEMHKQEIQKQDQLAAGPPAVTICDMSNPKCTECEKLIVGVFVRIKDKNLHVECFKCATCGTSLKNVGYYNINNKLYCDVHAKLAARQNPPAPNLVPVTVPPGGKIPSSVFTPSVASNISNAAPSSPQPGTIAPLPFHGGPKPFGGNVSAAPPPAAPISIPVSIPAPAPAPAPAAPAPAPFTIPSQQPQGGGAGGKGSVAGSTAPRRGRGVLNPNTGPQARIPLCGQCNRQIRGPFITALGKIWCPDHFVCVNAQCHRPLQDIGFVEEQEGLYCEYCFEKFLAPNCSKCNNKIKGDCLNAIGKQFHPECFSCTYCNKQFGNNPFFLEDSLPYCETDWNELFTTKCFACGFPIEAGDRWVEALNNNYHSQCFNCTMCKKNLEGQSFYAKGGRPFCKNHAR